MNEQPEWSLKQEIQKRKTQEILRALEAREIKTPLPSVSQSKTTIPVPASSNPLPFPHRLALLGPMGKPRILATRTGHTFSAWTKRQKQIAIVATILLITVCLVTVGVVIDQPFPQSTLPALPAVSSNEFITYLQRAGVIVSNLRIFTVPNARWNAKQEIQFEAYHGGAKGVFVILSYPSPAQAGTDAFKATYDPKFSQWNVTQISNVLVLAAPSTSSPFNAEIASHLTQYLVAPYRRFIPTATQSVFAR